MINQKRLFNNLISVAHEGYLFEGVQSAEAVGRDEVDDAVLF